MSLKLFTQSIIVKYTRRKKGSAKSKILLMVSLFEFNEAPKLVQVGGIGRLGHNRPHLCINVLDPPSKQALTGPELASEAHQAYVL